jgi:hypothetical protein
MQLTFSQLGQKLSIVKKFQNNRAYYVLGSSDQSIMELLDSEVAYPLLKNAGVGRFECQTKNGKNSRIGLPLDSYIKAQALRKHFIHRFGI